MMLLYSLLLIFQFSLTEISCVPATPSNSLLEDVKNIKEKFNSILGVVEKWNLIYTTQVEPRVVTATNTLTSIDSNVKNLQERAHIWDTFQLHISAWNDQMSTADRKLDIISKAQEKLLTLESKITTVASLDEKLEALSKKLDTTQESIGDLSKKIDSACAMRDPLFGEFAVRGMLSTLKQFERKLDKIQISSQNLLKQAKHDDLEGRSKLTINCNTPPIVEELLTDVSSKVDVIFDKMNGKYEDEIEDDYIDPATDDTTKVIREAKHDDDTKLVKKFVKRISQPCKDFNISLVDVKDTLDIIRNNTERLLESKNSQIKTNICQDEKVLLKIDHLMNYINYSDTTKDLSLRNHFIEQQKYLDSILNQKLMPVSIPCQNTVENTATGVKPTTSATTTITIKHEEMHLFTRNTLQSCSDLLPNETSGVYSFNPDDDSSMHRWEYTKRLCEFEDGHFWTVIQKRGTFYSGIPIDFSKNWEFYKRGFGDFRGEFWFGNEFIHRLTTDNVVMLRIVLEDFDGNKAFADFDTFIVGSEDDNYKITIGGYAGNASDSLSSHNHAQFSTFDRKNDDAPDCCPCAASYGGGWWFNSCFEANLNGIYHANPKHNDYYRGIIWETWLGNYSLKKSKMMVRNKPARDPSLTTTESYSHTTGLPPYLEDP